MANKLLIIGVGAVVVIAVIVAFTFVANYYYAVKQSEHDFIRTKKDLFSGTLGYDTYYECLNYWEKTESANKAEIICKDYK